MHKQQDIVLGVVVEVAGDISKIGMYNLSNDANILFNGELISGLKVGTFIIVNQGLNRIVTKVISEKVIDSQNSLKSEEFDNRFTKNSINRVVEIKAQGKIDKKGDFQITSSFVPMIGNEVVLATSLDIQSIFSLKIAKEHSIHIGNNLLDQYPIRIPISEFFASHIGIFGNTGSGKSNTLHKLFLELLRSDFKIGALSKSKFFVIDFNGEYTGVDVFTDFSHKRTFKINTRNVSESEPLPIKRGYLFDADILSILFDAKPGVQVPFLRNAIKLWDEKQNQPFFHFGIFVTGLLKRILTTGDSVNQNSLQNWLTCAKKYYYGFGWKVEGQPAQTTSDYSFLELLKWNGTTKKYYLEKTYLDGGSEGNIDATTLTKMKLDEISSGLSKAFNQLEQTPTQQLKMFLDFQRVYETSWNKINEEHLNGLFARMNKAFDSLEKAIEIKDDISNEFKAVNVVSLVRANQEITRLIPMLLSKMIYDDQKDVVAGNKIERTRHLIIDEAHNILNDIHQSSGDNWQDYRLGVFEEIIKEGRKFGFYLTLASQRPADISPTIMSQIHNYLIHRLVNDKDIQMLINTMPTLDKFSLKIIPSLGKGEAVLTGTAIRMPVIIKIPKEESARPDSDDINLIDLWKN